MSPRCVNLCGLASGTHVASCRRTSARAGHSGQSTEAPCAFRSATHRYADAAAGQAAPAATGVDCRFPASLRMVALMIAAMVHIAAAPNQA